MRFTGYLICPQHSMPSVYLLLEPLHCKNDDCTEGFLTCQFCHTTYPIINGVAIIVTDFVKYCETRVTTLGSLLINSKTSEMKSYIKSRGRCITTSRARNDRYEKGGSWFVPYEWLQYGYPLDDRLLSMLRWALKPQDFYDRIMHSVNPKNDKVVLDMGCSMGYSTLELAKKCLVAIGIDLSFSFIIEARRRLLLSDLKNVEFFVSDALRAPFTPTKFDLIFSLNLLELVDPTILLSSIHKLLKDNGQAVFADPYDYRLRSDHAGIIDGQAFRIILENSGFELKEKTETESHIPWIIKIYERCYLFYFVDLAIANKISKQKTGS